MWVATFSRCCFPFATFFSICGAFWLPFLNVVTFLLRFLLLGGHFLRFSPFERSFHHMGAFLLLSTPCVGLFATFFSMFGAFFIFMWGLFWACSSYEISGAQFWGSFFGIALPPLQKFCGVPCPYPVDLYILLHSSPAIALWVTTLFPDVSILSKNKTKQ